VTTYTREALDAVGAGAFVQKVIDPIVVDIQRRYSPLLAVIPSEKWDSDVYYFNRRVKLPSGGWVRDGGARPVGTGTYDQDLWRMKHHQTVGDVTKYAELVTKAQAGSIRGKEIEGAYKGAGWDLETAIVWGNADATAAGPDPHMAGFDSLISAYSGSGQNSIDKAGGTFALAYLDQLIDMVEQNLNESIGGDDWMFVTSSTAVSKAAQLLLAQQRYKEVPVAAGLNVLSYRDVPFVKSSFLATRSIQMGTVTSATATTGGVLPNTSTYIYQVSAVIARSGETIASAEVSQATGATTGTHVVDLSFSTPLGFQDGGPILYKVYRTAAAGATGTATLLGVVDASVSLAADGVTRVATTKIRDTGAALVPMNGSTTPGTLPAAYYGGNTAKKPLAAGHEGIYLVPRNRDYMLRPFVRHMQPLPLAATVSSPDSDPFAIMSDCVLAIRDPRMIGTLQRVAVSL
jgi:hypothetical protein